MKLYTGGKAGIKRRSLIHINAHAEQYGRPPDEPWLHTPTADIPATKIRVLGWWLFGRHLDPSGDLYIALPDNAVKNLNLRVSGVKHYGAWASAKRHKLELVQPSGNPTNAPAYPNRFCFSADDPGVLTLNLVAVLTNNGPAWVLTNRVRFEADDIGSAQKVWSTNNPGGRPVASGSELTATLYYIHLPTNNSDFGLKFARVLLDGEIHDQKCFWAFYDADAYNYPGCSGPPYNENDPQPGMHLTPPNYFFYYMQTAARYGNPLFDYRGSWETRPAQYPTNQPPYPYYVEARKYRTGYSPGYGNNGTNTYQYINVFAYACRHEATHCNYFDQWWPNGWGSTNDVDQPTPDSIPTAVELGLDFDPTLTATRTPPDGIYNWDDDQEHTLEHEPIWGAEDVKSANKADWAHPGAQYP